MNILITGGVGFIGSNFVYYILNKYSEYKIVKLPSDSYYNWELWLFNPMAIFK